MKTEAELRAAGYVPAGEPDSYRVKGLADLGVPLEDGPVDPKLDTRWMEATIRWVWAPRWAVVAVAYIPPSIKWRNLVRYQLARGSVEARRAFLAAFDASGPEAACAYLESTI